MRFCLLAAVAALPAAGPACADQPRTGVLIPADVDAQLGSVSFGVYKAGRRIGVAHSSAEKTGNGPNARYVFETETIERLPRWLGGGETRIAQRREYDARPPHALLLATHIESGHAPSWQVTLERVDHGHDGVVTQAGEAHRFPVRLIAPTLADETADRSWLRTNPLPGATFAVNDIDLRGLCPAPGIFKLLGRAPHPRNPGDSVLEVELLNGHGQRVCLIRFDPETLSTAEHVYPSGEEFRVEAPNPARGTEEPADPAPPEVVPVDRPLGPGPYENARLTLFGYRGTSLRSGPGQAVSQVGEGVWTCRLGRGEGEPHPVTDDDARDALTESPRYPFRHPKVLSLARTAVAGARTPREKVDRLVGFVHRHIRYERDATPELFELLRTRAGNCQSFALLLACLARAEGIPAREVVGLMYAGDAARGFGGHAWVEVARDGVWHPVDATTGRVELDASYLRVDDTDLETTLKLDEPPALSALLATPRALGGWLAERPWAWLVVVGIGVVVAVRVRRTRRREVARVEAVPPETTPPS